MCNPLAVVAAATVVSAGVGYAGARKQASAQKSAQRAATADAEKERQRAETAFNRANQQQPAIAALLSKNKASTSRGIGSTFLTGAKGIPDLSGYLGGRPSLLGA